jgi:hypothetical protein
VRPLAATSDHTPPFQTSQIDVSLPMRMALRGIASSVASPWWALGTTGTEGRVSPDETPPSARLGPDRRHGGRVSPDESGSPHLGSPGPILRDGGPGRRKPIACPEDRPADPRVSPDERFSGKGLCRSMAGPGGRVSPDEDARAREGVTEVNGKRSGSLLLEPRRVASSRRAWRPAQPGRKP